MVNRQSNKRQRKEEGCVRIKAYDQFLLDALDSEMKLLKREKDDEAALDAL